MNEPLAIKLRPNKLKDILGQEHLTGENKIIYNLVKNKKLFSMILFGKPGTGKTSLATAIVQELDLPYRMLNAVVNNKKDIDIVIEEAKINKGIVLIMDEIHRLNKDKQDLLLPVLESGLITLIGMTTSNPYHSINPAIRSRCQIFELRDLTKNDIKIALDKAVKSNFLDNIKIDEETINYIADISGFDLRMAYNLLEVSYYSTEDKVINLELVKNINNRSNLFYDKNEDGYYDVLSAFQKSIRGSDVNASLHYLARLLEAEDLESICRRLSVIVYEDIGLANPGMGVRVMCAIAAVERLGLPEARIPLAEVVIELALSPKSNSAEMAIDIALNELRSKYVGNIPKHLKNSSKEYKYPHNYKNSYIKQQYLPDNIINSTYYHPKDNKNEKILKEIMDNLNRI